MSLLHDAIDTIRHPKTHRHFIAFVLIGSFVFVVDAGTFQILLLRGLPLALSATIAYALGIFTHFNLNRSLNFRNFDRSIGNQAITYAIVVAFCYVVTIGVIEGGVRLLGMVPLYAKIIAVVINAPLSFFGHRHLTFSHGIIAAVRRLQASRNRS